MLRYRESVTVDVVIELVVLPVCWLVGRDN